jgi:ABC-type sulfate transport system permease subunit
MTNAHALVRVLKILFVFIGLFLATVGVLFFISGLQSYLDGSRSEAVLGNLTLSVAIISFPLAILFGYKAAKKYLLPTNNYQIPDSPMKTILYIILTGGFVMTTALSIIVFLFYLNA